MATKTKSIVVGESFMVTTNKDDVLRTFTVDTLIQALSKFPPTTAVAISVDVEGNDFKPVYEVAADALSESQLVTVGGGKRVVNPNYMGNPTLDSIEGATKVTHVVLYPSC